MLHVYSKKLKKMLRFDVGNSGKLIPVGATPLSGTNIMYAWNNSFDNWVDKGWNNTFDGWQDGGWNNSFDNWVDKGWNNTFDGWQDGGWSNSAGSWGDSGGTGGGCFITTACVEKKGLTDDCHEMQVLRHYRDTLIETDATFRSKVIEYYRKAPLIIQEIDARNDKDKIYGLLYDEMIKPCVNMLDNGRTEEAKKLYLDYYEKLVKQYLAS